MESVIDQYYRRIFLDHYFSDATLAGTPEVQKWTAPCPFCSHTRSTPAKRRSKCSVLMWVPTKKTWTFSCRNGGTVQCSRALPFANLLKNLNPELGRQYVEDRYSAGTAGKGTNCPNPEFLKRIGGSPKFQSRTKPQKQRPHDPSKSKSTDGQSEDRPKS